MSRNQRLIFSQSAELPGFRIDRGPFAIGWVWQCQSHFGWNLTKCGAIRFGIGAAWLTLPGKVEDVS